MAPWAAPLPMYRAGTQIARALLVLLPIYLALGVLQHTFSFVWAQQQDLSSEPSSPSDVFAMFDSTFWLLAVLGLLSFGLFVALAILFGLWMARVHGNAEALSRSKLPTGVGWTVAAWYIPVAGGFLALGPLLSIWERGPGGPKGLPAAWAVLFSLSYLASLVGGVMGFVVGYARGMEGQSTAAMEPVMALPNAIGTLLLVVSGVCMWLCVRAIQDWQERASAGNVPPPTGPSVPQPWA